MGWLDENVSKAKEIAGDAWEGMSTLDKAALITSPVPGVGTALGITADTVAAVRDPSAANIAMIGTNFIPFARLGRFGVNAGKGLFNPIADKSYEYLSNLRNYVPGFYSGNLAKQGAGLGLVSGRGLFDLAVQRHSPQAMGTFREYGVGRGAQQVAKRELKKFDTAKTAEGQRTSQKKIMGQLNQQRLFNDQYYKDQGKFYGMLDDLDQRDFAALDSKTYFKLVKGATGLSKRETDLAFEQIAKFQGVDPTKNYRMALRNPTTGASGKLIDPIRKGVSSVLGGAKQSDIADIFKGGGFGKSYRKMYKELNKVEGVRIRNPEGWRKGEPAILVGDHKSDAYELGGVNYVTMIKPDGKMVSVINDENDLLNIPLKKIGLKNNASIKAPAADRMVTVVTPIEFDLVNIAKNKELKKATPGIKGKEWEDIKLQTEVTIPIKEGTKETVEETMGEIAGETGRKLPSGGPTRANLKAGEALAGVKGKRDYAGAGLNWAITAGQATKPLVRGYYEENEE